MRWVMYMENVSEKIPFIKRLKYELVKEVKRYVLEHKIITNQELKEYLGCHIKTANRILAKLEQNGFIKKLKEIKVGKGKVALYIYSRANLQEILRESPLEDDKMAHSSQSSESNEPHSNN